MEMTTDHLPCFQNFWISGFLAGSSIQSIRWVFHNNPMFFRWRAFGTDGMGQAGEVDSKVVFYGVPTKKYVVSKRLRLKTFLLISAQQRHKLLTTWLRLILVISAANIQQVWFVASVMWLVVGWSEVMWFVASCHVMWCDGVSCHVMRCHALCSHVMRCHLMRLWCDGILCDSMWWIGNWCAVNYGARMSQC